MVVIMITHHEEANPLGLPETDIQREARIARNIKDVETMFERSRSSDNPSKIYFQKVVAGPEGGVLTLERYGGLFIDAALEGEEPYVVVGNMCSWKIHPGSGARTFVDEVGEGEVVQVPISEMEDIVMKTAAADYWESHPDL